LNPNRIQDSMATTGRTWTWHHEVFNNQIPRKSANFGTLKTRSTILVIRKSENSQWF
jgi:hypothetical protein